MSAALRRNPRRRHRPYRAYDVTIDDGHGGTVKQTITITLTGADDAVGRARKASGPLLSGDESNDVSDGRSY